jgi:hypothetical protein
MELLAARLPPLLARAVAIASSSVFTLRPDLLPELPLFGATQIDGALSSAAAGLVGVATLRIAASANADAGALQLASVRLLTPRADAADATAARRVGFDCCHAVRGDAAASDVRLARHVAVMAGARVAFSFQAHDNSAPLDAATLLTLFVEGGGGHAQRSACLIAARDAAAMHAIDSALAGSFGQWAAAAATALAENRRFSRALRSPWAWVEALAASDGGGSDGESACRGMSDELARVTISGLGDLMPRRCATAVTTPPSCSLVMPLGTGCSSAVACRSAGLRSDGLPFDWVISTLRGNVDVLVDLLGSASAVQAQRLDDSAAAASTVASALSLPFDASRSGGVLPVRHVPNTNRYISLGDGDDSASPQPSHLFDAEASIVASHAEAARFRRRCERVRECVLERVVRPCLAAATGSDQVTEPEKETAKAAWPSPVATLLFVHIGRPHSDAEEEFVVAGAPVAARSDVNARSAGNGVIDAARRIADALTSLLTRSGCRHGAAAGAAPRVLCVLLAFNACGDGGGGARPFTEAWVAPGGLVDVVVAHQFVGYVAPEAAWDSIGHIVARRLPKLATVVNSAMAV